MRKTYHDEVVISYLDNFNNAITSLDSTITDIHTCFNKILTDNEFTEEQETRWTQLLATIETKRDELKEKIDEKYNEMIEKADVFDKWYSDANNLVSSTPIKVEQETVTNLSGSYDHIKYTVEAVSKDGEGYPSITYKKETIENRAKQDETDPTVYHHVVGSTDTTSQTFSIKTDDDYGTYVTNASSISF